MSKVKYRKQYVESHDNLLLLNEYYKLSYSEEYRRIPLEPSRFKGNVVLTLGLSIIILFLYPIRLLYDFICLMLYYIRTKESVKLFPKKIIPYPASSAIAEKLLINANVDTSDIVIIVKERNNTNESKIRQLPFSSLIKVSDIVLSLCEAFIYFYISIFKNGIRTIFLSLDAFEWFVTYHAHSHLPQDTELFFYHHMNQWAALIDCLPHKHKYLFQHGTGIIKHNEKNIGLPFLNYDKEESFWTYNLPLRYCSIERIYTFTNREYESLRRSILNCNPYVIVVGYSLRTTQMPTNKPVVVIIGFYRAYSRKEENVLSGLQNKDVTIYIKNHPTQDPTVYKDFLEKYSFELLTEPVYPKADVVISYDSTLALEYEEIGTKVYYYSDMRIESILDYLSNLKHSL